MNPRFPILSILAAASILPTAWGIEPSVLKLSASGVTAPANNKFGSSVALNEKWLLVGEIGNEDDGRPASGVVHVFNATTGAWVRKLKAALSSDNANYGNAIALQGDIALIGASGDVSNAGAAYIVNVATGVELFKLPPPLGSTSNFGNSVAIAGDIALVGEKSHDSAKGRVWKFDLSNGAFVSGFGASDAANGDQFGSSLAAEGHLVVVGAPNDDSDAGSAYLFDARTEAELGKIVANNAAAGDLFGTSVAISGGRVLAGAPGKNMARGEGYIIDVWTRTVESNLTASDAANGDRFGQTVAIRGNQAVIGAPVNGQGVAYFVDVADADEIGKLQPYGMTGGSGFGEAVAMWGNNAVVAAPFENFSAFEEGFAYFYRSLVGALPFETAAVQGSYAPGAPFINFGVIGEAGINEQSEIGFSAKLTGWGSNANKDSGVWTDLPSSVLSKVAKAREAYSPGVLYGVLGSVACNADSNMIFRSSLTGTGVGKTNNQMAGLFNATSGLTRSIRTGSPVDGLSTPIVSSIVQFVQPRVDGSLAAMLKFRVGVNSVIATSDSGVLLYEEPASVVISEGQDEPGALAKFGEFSPRVAFGDDRGIWTAARVSPTNVTTANNQALYLYNAGVTTIVATKGAPAAGVSGSFFGSFLSEAVSSTDREVYRATLTTGVTAANNEGIWYRTGGAAQLVAREGFQVTPLATGILWSRFVKFWPVGDQIIIQGTVRGPGVNASNDQVLVLFQTDGSQALLFREGDRAPGCDGLRIGVIQKVEASLGGKYLVLASVVGTTRDKDQALFGGDVFAGDATNPGLRVPMLKVRKGTRYHSELGSAARVRAITVTATGTDTAGAGSKGLARAINDTGDFVFVLDLDNGGRQLVKGEL
jgi:hypothetical protein